MDPKQTGFNDADCIDVMLKMDKYWALVNTVRNLWVPKYSLKLFSS